MTLGLIQRQTFDKAIPECKDLDYSMYVGDIEESYGLAKKALSHNASAIICANPNSARGAYRAIKDCGKHVGKDVAVFSLGAPSSSEARFHPSLSYASQNYAKLGEAAAKILIAMVDRKETRSHLVIKNKITLGNSFFVLKNKRRSSHLDKKAPVATDRRLWVALCCADLGDRRDEIDAL